MGQSSLPFLSSSRSLPVQKACALTCFQQQSTLSHMGSLWGREVGMTLPWGCDSVVGPPNALSSILLLRTETMSSSLVFMVIVPYLSLGWLRIQLGAGGTQIIDMLKLNTNTKCLPGFHKATFAQLYQLTDLPCGGFQINAGLSD